MLTTLRVQNLAIVDSLCVEFTGGLNVLTGETGAGKSILVEALQLVLGGRFNPEVLRAGTDEGSVEALFQGPDLERRLEVLGLPAGEECLIRRTVGPSTRGRVYINGALSTVAMLQRLARGLIDLAGQHQQVSLLDATTHLHQLDAFAGNEALLARHKERWTALRELRAQLAEVRAAEATRAERRDLLAFQVRELEALGIAPGEEARLTAERRRLGSAVRLQQLLSLSLEHLSSDGGARDSAASALARLREAAGLDASLLSVTALLEAAVVEIDEAARDLAGRARQLEDPQRLAEVDGRLESIRSVARKHATTSDQLATVLDRVKSDLATLEGWASERARMEREVKAAELEATASAGGLSESRVRAGRRFAHQMAAELARLAMENTRVSFELRATDLGASGLDEGQLLISANPGEPLKALADIASGGELSRVLLALKRVLARTDPARTHVFDEIDAGIGGAAAEAVGQMLNEVARGTQVICVTHLPQIAAFADHHLEVSKGVVDGRTLSSVRALSEPERRREVARMLAGSAVSAVALACAGELIQKRGSPVRRAARRGRPQPITQRR